MAVEKNAEQTLHDNINAGKTFEEINKELPFDQPKIENTSVNKPKPKTEKKPLISQNDINVLLRLGLSMDVIQAEVTPKNVANTIRRLTKIQMYANSHKWLVYPEGKNGEPDYTREPKVDINILADTFFEDTNYFSTPDYLPGYLYTGKHWQRISNKDAQQRIN